MNEDTGKKLLIGGGAIALGVIILNQIYTSGFQDGLMAAGAAPGEWDRSHGPGFPFGLLLLIGLGIFIYSKVTKGGRRGSGFNLGFGGRRGFYDDRRQPWQPPQGSGGYGQPAAPAQPGQPFAPGHGQFGYGYGQPAPGAAPTPPAPSSPPAPRTGDPNPPVI